MPTLKQLACSIELGGTNTKLTEYGTRYSDGHVETFVAVPKGEVPFSIHLESEGYIAPGLAMFVYMDGVYQCNRNRRGLLVPGAGMPPEKYQVDLRVRQKEAKQPDGSFLGRDWTFHGLNLVSSDGDIDTSKEFLENMGTIEVIVLRCKDAPIPQTSIRQPSTLSHHPVVVLPKPKPSSSKEAPKPPIKAPSTKSQPKAPSKAPSKTVTVPIGNLLFGGDGAADEDPRLSYKRREQHNHDDPRAYDSPPMRRSKFVPGAFPSSVGATYSEDNYDERHDRHRRKQYIPDRHVRPPAQYRPRPSIPHDTSSSTLYAPDSDAGQQSYYNAYRPYRHSPDMPEPNQRPRYREPHSDYPMEFEPERRPVRREYRRADRLPIIDTTTEDDESMIDRVGDYTRIPHVPRSYLPRSNEAVWDEPVESPQAAHYWGRSSIQKDVQKPASTTVSSNWRTKLWAESLPRPGGSVSAQWSDPSPWPTSKSPRSSLPKWPPRPDVHTSPYRTEYSSKVPGNSTNEPEAQVTSWDKAPAAIWDAAPAANWDATPATSWDAAPAVNWDAIPVAQADTAPAPTYRPQESQTKDEPHNTTWDDSTKSAAEKQPENLDWNTEPQPVTSGEKEAETTTWDQPEATPAVDNNEPQGFDWDTSAQDTPAADQQEAPRESQGWDATLEESNNAATGDWNTTPVEDNNAAAGDWENTSAEPVAQTGTWEQQPEPKAAETKPTEQTVKPSQPKTAQENPKSHPKADTKPHRAPPSPTSQAKPHRSTDGAHSPPKPHSKPYWQDWNKKPTDQTHNPSTSGFRYLAPEEPLPKVPAQVAKKQNIEHQVKTGKGAQYVHLCSRPEYLDEMKKPYAVFTFRYRGKKVIEQMFGIEVKEDGEDLKAKLADMTKDQLAEELFNLRMASKSSKAGRKSPTVVSKVDAWMEKSAGIKAPSVSRRSRAQGSSYSKQGSKAGAWAHTSNQAASQAQGNDWGDTTAEDANGGGGDVQAIGGWDTGAEAATPENQDTAAAW